MNQLICILYRHDKSNGAFDHYEISSMCPNSALYDLEDRYIAAFSGKVRTGPELIEFTKSLMLATVELDYCDEIQDDLGGIMMWLTNGSGQERYWIKRRID
jgi:hypothetical protein